MSYSSRCCFLFIVLVPVLLLSCTDKKTEEAIQLEKALIFAGDNRVELEKVLYHYNQCVADSLKYKAAHFLIRNMPDYYSYYSPENDSIKDLYQAVAQKKMSEDVAIEVAQKKFVPFLERNQKVIYDSHVITASYLIRNIDHAFGMWEKQPWGKYIKFEDFCEYILPYRVAFEPLSEWRETYAEAAEQILDSLFIGSDVLQAYKLINENIIMKLDWFFTIRTSSVGLFDMSAEYMWNNRIGNCWNRTYFTTYLLRSIGIPCGVDYLKQAPKSATNHCWSFIVDTTGLTCDFEGGDHRMPIRDRFVTFYELKGKIYRKMFASQKLQLEEVNQEKGIPFSLSDKHEKDVSGEYFPNERIAVRCENIPKRTNIAYLCLFNNSEWIPVDWAEIKDDTARFEHMDWRNIVYLVGYYKEGRIIPAAPPILTTEMAKHTISARPNMQKKNKMRLERKYTEAPIIIFLRDLLLDGRFQGSNSPDFKNTIDMHVITQRPPGSYLTVKLDTVYKFRYVRFLARDGIRSDISEVEFYSPSDSVNPLKGIPMGNPPVDGDNSHRMEMAFDGDPLTCYASANLNNAWVGLDFGKKTEINKIRFAPRGDDNSVREGDEYELKYLSMDGWVSLGRQTARTYFLEFSGGPDKALYLLSNLTRGREERPFTYENDTQVWW